MSFISKPRQNCVFCDDNNKLISIQKLKEPYHVINNKGEYEVEIGYCENCYSLQLMNLLNPDILYDGNYYIVPCANYNWNQHNISLIQFIVSSINTSEPLIEVGSSSFVLGKHLIDYYKDYTVFDFSLSSCEKRSDVKYIEGNCENYKFEKNTNIIMSNVFEHLYEPKKFIENCSNNNVKNIIISIPNMNDNNVFHITQQHTFVYNDKDIKHIFESCNYKCMKEVFFNTNDQSFPCLFFYFSLNIDESITPTPRYIDETRHLYSFNLLKNKINVPPNTFISTASMISVKLFSMIKNQENIIGVIDMNGKLHDQIFANTTIKIYPYEYLQNFDETSNIVVFQKKNDITKCIRKFNEKINIIYF